jgi:pimeloyl-ACP methyl ester carboxylesterase
MSRNLCESALGQVHYLDVGPRDGLPIVLLHQTPRSIDEFAEVIPLISASRRVIAVDTPGYGCSDRPATQPTIADYADAVVAVLDAAGCDRIQVVGHHTGAVIAVELAAAHPPRVAGIGLSGPVYVDEAARQALAAHFAQWHVTPDGSHLADKWAKFLGWVPDPALVQRLVVDLFYAGETSEFGHFAVAAYRMEERLRHVRCPGLLIFGLRDPFSSPEQAAPFRSVLRPLNEVAIDAGVFMPNEAPRAFADAVLAWRLS